MKERTKKILFIAFLVFIILGFSVPLFAPNEKQENNKEFKLCKNDSDCILICNGKVVYVNCTNNLCERTSC